MKTTFALALGAAAALALASTAHAADGCGRGFHRGPYGHCRPNEGPPVVGPGPVVGGPGPWTVGVFYPGHGYWDGHRWWGHREHWHGGWRYR
jgi:hypothetical protein